jgi:type III restriction enzyme
MKQLNYQIKAIRELVEKTIDLLKLSGNRKQLIFKAPTGAGKTVMASQMLSDLTTELQSRSDLPYQQVAYIWIAPNKLHQQSYFKMKDFFSETHQLRAVMYDELDHSEGYIKPGEILFVNWESINKEKNIMVRDTEQSASIFEITRRTQEEHGLPIVVVIDEEHLFWSKTADKSAKVLQQIKPKVEIRISATPKTQSDYKVTIARESVVAEEMIKKQVLLNPDIYEGYSDERELNQHLIHKAFEKRNQLAAFYRQQGANINPLLLIQLPNDTSEAMTVEDTAIAEQVKTYLKEICGIHEDNGKLAIWLSKEKANLDDLEQPDNLAEVLLFKQAIALGWDCPRAAVLLIFRKMQSETFTIQTVGRILRMPEQKFYPINALNLGYVYTDISKDRIQIVAEDMDYLNKDALLALRREEIKNVALDSFYSVYKSSDRNRLGPDFKKVLIECFKRNWVLAAAPALFTFGEEDGEIIIIPTTASGDATKSQTISNREKVADIIRFDVKSINIEIPSDMVMPEEVGIYDIEKKSKFARTAGELQRIYTEYCREQIGGKFEKVHSTGVLSGYLLEAMEELFELFEQDAMKVILYHLNKPKFTAIIQLALKLYSDQLQAKRKAAKERGYESYKWEVPAERFYKEETHHLVKGVADHALLPFIELNNAFTPEKRFSAFLEKHSDDIKWWYKNGDEGKQHYSVPYTNSKGEMSLFYVDFVVRMKNEQIFLFDTKSEESDSEAPNKHNALLKYMQHPDRAEQNLKGGVIIEDHDVWYYPNYPITTTSDVTGWDAWFPDEYK